MNKVIKNEKMDKLKTRNCGSRQGLGYKKLKTADLIERKQIMENVHMKQNISNTKKRDKNEIISVFS